MQTSTHPNEKVKKAPSPVNVVCPIANCDQQTHDGKRLCKTHLEQQRVRMAEYRANRKLLKLCSRCPNPARVLPDGKPSTLCDKCRAHVRDLEARQTAAFT